MSTIVRLTGFSEALLRAWERRYRILEPVRGPGGQRFYTDNDLRVLGRVRELMAQGRSIGEIALRGREALLLETPEAPPAPLPAPGTPGREIDKCRQAVVEGAITLDARKIERALDHAFASISPDAAISEVIERSARDIGDLWATGRCTVAGGHLASYCFMLRVLKLLESAGGSGPGAPRAVAACIPDERHELGVLVVSYCLARAGFEVSYFGAALPLEDLEHACEAIGPQLVCVSVARQPLYQTYRPQLLSVLGRWAERTHFILGGVGLPTEDDEVSRMGATLWPASRPLRELVQGTWLQSARASLKLEE